MSNSGATEMREQSETVTISRRFLRRRKLLQVVGVILIVMAGFPPGLQVSEPTLHATPAFFLILGVLMLLSGLLLHKPGE